MWDTLECCKQLPGEKTTKDDVRCQKILTPALEFAKLITQEFSACSGFHAHDDPSKDRKVQHMAQALKDGQLSFHTVKRDKTKCKAALFTGVKLVDALHDAAKKLYGSHVDDVTPHSDEFFQLTQSLSTLPNIWGYLQKNGGMAADAMSSEVRNCAQCGARGCAYRCVPKRFLCPYRPVCATHLPHPAPCRTRCGSYHHQPHNRAGEERLLRHLRRRAAPCDRRAEEARL
jgi:hypothetical protein